MKKTVLYLALAALFIFNPFSAHAAPATFSLSSPGGDVIQASIIGGDANSTVFLHYLSGNTGATISIGSTDSQGNLNTTVDSGKYSILGNSQAYVIVGGEQSNIATWPDYSHSGNLTLYPAGLSLTVGQTTTVSASVSSSLSIISNDNPTVASVSVSGNQITVNANANGAANILVCASTIGCNTLYVSVGAQSSNVSTTQNTSTVTSSNSSTPASVSVSQGSVTLNVGQVQSFSVTGTDSIGISNNSDIRVAIATLTGNTLNINAISAGTSDISLCSVDINGNSSCSGIDVTVVQPTTPTTNSLTQNVSFPESSINMVVGGSQIIPIYGSGGFTLSQNSGASAVSASVSGTNLYVNALGTGGSNITVCETTTQCANLYVYVTAAPTNAAVSTSNATTPATSSSYSFVNYLYEDMTPKTVSNPDIVALQQRLKTDGLFSGPVTGYFGPITKASVEAFQKEYNLTQIGVVGPATRALLNQGK